MSADLAYQAVFQSVSDAILVLSEEGRAIDCNPAALALFRCTREDIIGTTPNDWSPVYQPDGRRSDVASAEIIGAVMRGEVMSFDWTNRRRDGTPVEVSVTLSKFMVGNSPRLVVVSRDISSTKVAGRRLAESEQRFRALFEKAPLAYQSLDMAANILEVNDAWLKLMGDVRRDEVIGCSIADFLTEQSMPTLARNFPIFQKQGHIEGPVFDLQRPDGEVRTVTINGRIGYDEAGNAVRTHCILTDITERIVAEAALHDSEARFRTLFEQAAVGVAEIDSTSGRFLTINRKYCDIVGYSQSQMLKIDFASITQPDDLALDFANMERLKSGEIAYFEMDKRYFHKDGHIVWVKLTVSPLWAPGETPTRHIAVVQDITERIQAEDEVQESRERYCGLSEASSEAIFISEKGVCLEQNGQAEQMFGYTLAEAVGRMGTEWIAPEDRDLVMENMIAGYEQPYEVRCLRKDGSTFPGLIRGRMTHYRNRHVRVTTISDISAIKHAEAALKESEERWKFAIEGAGDGVWDWNIQTGDAVFSRRWKQMIGYADNEIANDATEWSSRVHPDDLPKVMAALQDHMDGKTLAAKVEFRMACKNGEWLWILGRGMVVSRDAEGKPLRLVGTNTDVTERKAAAEKIEHLAFYDPLTELPNRRLSGDRLEQALTSSARHNRYGALMLLDMDDFKRLNDTMGHDVGDQFLIEVAHRLQSAVREGDTVARHGGDEFVVILEDLSDDALAPMQAEQVAVKILKAVSEPYTLSMRGNEGESTQRSYHCTSSIGITLFHGTTLSADELMRRADTAMYQAKAAGRNSLRFFDPDMQAAVEARAALDDDLREAVLGNQFALHYQPQVDAEGRMFGAEALLRWPHPTRGLVSPVDFIPLAEATGMILPLGHWVLQTACAQLVRWAKDPLRSHLTLAVNVSARQLKMPNFVEEVLAIMAHHGTNPLRLKLELTESLLVDDVNDVIAKMSALKEKGVSFSLDDFGTGYSSLSYLKRLPLDQLKIDRSFVRDVLTNANDATIARTIVALAQSMGISVIAEGVETEAQRDFLAASGCLAYQGYLFGRPVPIEQL